MSRIDSDVGSVPGPAPQDATETIAPEAGARQSGLFWLAAIGSLLVARTGLLFASLPVLSPRRRAFQESRRKSLPKTAAVTAVIRGAAEDPHREPWWLIAFTIAVIVGVGLLLIFYAHLPPFLRY